MTTVAMSLAEEWGWRPANSNPAREVRAHPERSRRRYLSQDELTRLRAQATVARVSDDLGV